MKKVAKGFKNSAENIFFEVDGYKFSGDGNEVIGEDEELEELWVETPEGENICLIERR